jgi:hypothetical protein
MGKMIEKEAERLEQETGIDFKKYRNPEMVEKISDLIGFYRQTNAYMFRYTAILLIIIIALCFWFHTREMSSVGIALFLIAGTFFSLVEGISWGLMKLAKKAVTDGADVVTMMLDFLKEIKADITALVKNKPTAKIAISDMFRGISYDVFIPTVNQIIQEKLKLFAKPINFLIGNSIFYLTRSLSAVMDKAATENSKKETMPVESEQEKGKQEENDKKIDQLIDEARAKIGPLADSVSRKVAIPAKIVFNVTLFIGVPILLIIYFIFK